jgi:putative Mg2+ transporter-C (MgtC) family protein
MSFEAQIITRLALAALLGALIGIERELKHKPIGLRTNVLISTSAALIMLLSTALMSAAGGNDLLRLAAAFIQGLGFLGAGAVLRERGAVIGLTTAAVILAVAGIGLAAGAGQWLLALSATAITLFVLVGLETLERKLHTKCQTVAYSLRTTDAAPLLVEINRVLAEHNVHLHSVQVIGEEDAQRIEFAVCNSDDLNNTLVTRALVSQAKGSRTESR